MRAADIRRDRGGLRQSPRAGLVPVRGRHVVENGLDDRPRGLNAVLTSEKRADAYHGVAQETLLGVHLIPARVVDHLELRGIPNQ